MYDKPESTPIGIEVDSTFTIEFTNKLDSGKNPTIVTLDEQEALFLLRTLAIKLRYTIEYNG